MKVCRKCKNRKALFLFSKHKNHKYGVNAICKKCDIERKNRLRQMAIGWEFPWKSVNHPEYIKVRDEFFAQDYGWHCNDGKGWEYNGLTATEKARIYRANRDNE